MLAYHPRYLYKYRLLTSLLAIVPHHNTPHISQPPHLTTSLPLILSVAPTMLSRRSASVSLSVLLVTLSIFFTLSASSAVSPVVRQNASCHKCAPGKVCVGPTGNKKCVTPMNVGETCGQDPFWVCMTGLTCEHFVCRGKFVPEGGRCTDGGLRCRQGFTCAETATVKKCVKPMQEGKQCGNDPYWVCRDGLVCRGGVCQRNRIPRDVSCRFPEAVCEHGLVCAGPPKNPRCVKAMGKGGQCSTDPYWVCRSGLKCVDGVCVW